MNRDLEEIRRFAVSTLGEMPEVIELIGNFSTEMAREQFRENSTLYLGRKNVPNKILALIAMGVSLANGQEKSSMIHFKLARKFGADPLEIMDALKAAKMALMASTLSSMSAIYPVVEKNFPQPVSQEVEKILNKVKKESGMGFLPENLNAVSRISFDILNEHLKEKTELLSPYKLDQKFVFLISFAVSISIRYEECAIVYLNQFIRFGGTVPEIEDAISIARFITGNRVLTSAVPILRAMEAMNTGEPSN
jgi:alkylhydroperoxidase/carboxymuconolactone decarboxylase family protein YurZ